MYHRFYLFVFVLTHSIMNSQTGPAGVGSSTNNVLWLKADAGTSSTVSNTPISAWNDQSGNGINVTQTISAQQPSFAVNVINNKPAIQFDNVTTTNDKMIAPDSPILDNTSGYSFFNVVRPQNVDDNARTIVSKRTDVSVDQSFMLFFYTGSKYFADLQTTNDRFNTTRTYTANNNYILNLVYDGKLAASQRAKAYTGETLEITATETSSLIPDNNSPLLIGTTNSTDSRPFGGYIAEIIIYTVTVNDAQRIIVNNYLSSKYDIALTVNDKYNGDASANGNYDFNVAGIGAEVSGPNSAFDAITTLGMGLISKSGLENGDYILAGHATTVNNLNFTNVSGISGANPARWERIWYIDVTNAGAVLQADIEFDMVAGGMGGTIPMTPSNYKLLYRSGTSGTWTEVATASSISGNKIIFNSYNFNNNANDGYYTIGTTNNAVSPLPIELLSFEATLKDDKQVLLNWITSTEKNNDFFEIQRSDDAYNWTIVGTQKGAGNSVTLKNYQFTDKEPYSSISYYRLKQIDFDKTFTYSKLVSVDFLSSPETITNLHPNPTKDVVNFDWKASKKGNIIIELLDYKGGIVYSDTKFLEEGTTNLTLGISECKNGIYLLRVTNENTRKSSFYKILKL